MASKPQQNIKQKPSTQAHLPIAEIANGVVIMKDGSLRMVLLVSAINFDLRSQEEQDSLIIGYQSFLNALEFPIEVVVQSRRLNLNPYLKLLEKRKNEVSSELVANQIDNYYQFLNELLSVANIMTKQFFVVIPFIPPILKKESIMADFWQSIGRQVPRIEITDFDKYYKELSQRARLVASGLNSLGLRAVQLNTQELIELFYKTYNPSVSMQEELKKPQDVTSKSLIKDETAQTRSKPQPNQP